MSLGKRAVPLMALLVSAPLRLLADPLPGHYPVTPLPQTALADFTTAIQDDAVWNSPENAIAASFTPSGEQRLLWAGAEIKTMLTMGKLTVGFTRPAMPDTSEENFELEISKETQRMVLRSSAPSHPAFAGGIIAPSSPTSSFFKFIPGAKDTGFVALIPKTQQGNWFSLALCPITRTRENGRFRFNTSGYNATSIHFAPKAEVLARQDTGEATGRASISILTSLGIPRSVTYERTVDQPSPRVEAIYYPDSSELPNTASSQRAAGIQVRGELISPTKSTWSKSTEGVAHLQQFSLANPIEISQDGMKTQLEGVGCALIVSGIFSRDQL